MSTPRILDFGSRPHEALLFLQFVAQKKAFAWQFEHHPEFSKEYLEGAVAAFIDPEMSSEILPQFQVVPTQVRAVELLDSLFLEQGVWYPRLLIHEVLRRVLVAEARDLDIRAPAFVIGEGALCRVVAAALAEMGIAEIYLIGDVERLEKQRQILSRSQLGIVFHVLASEELTMQAISAGIVVNTADLSERKVLLTDLSYFNFMKQAGFALDLVATPDSNTLLEEASRADLRILPSVLIMKTLLALWFEKLAVQETITDQEIVQWWTEFLRQNPPSV